MSEIFEIIKNSLAFFAVFRVRGLAIGYGSFLIRRLNEIPQTLKSGEYGHEREYAPLNI